MRERESGGRRLAADIGIPLEGERMITGAVVGCAEGSVHVGVFGTGCVSGLGTDDGLDTGKCMVEGCFGVGEGRGRDV